MGQAGPGKRHGHHSPGYLLSIRRDSLGLIASLHEHRQQNHSAMLGSNMQRCDAVAAGVAARACMPSAQQGVDNLYVASRHCVVQHCVACRQTKCIGAGSRPAQPGYSVRIRKAESMCWEYVLPRHTVQCRMRRLSRTCRLTGTHMWSLHV